MRLSRILPGFPRFIGRSEDWFEIRARIYPAGWGKFSRYARRAAGLGTLYEECLWQMDEKRRPTAELDDDERPSRLQ